MAKVIQKMMEMKETTFGHAFAAYTNALHGKCKIGHNEKGFSLWYWETGKKMFFEFDTKEEFDAFINAIDDYYDDVTLDAEDVYHASGALVKFE